jgi:hypothetical protein
MIERSENCGLPANAHMGSSHAKPRFLTSKNAKKGKQVKCVTAKPRQQTEDTARHGTALREHREAISIGQKGESQVGAWLSGVNVCGVQKPKHKEEGTFLMVAK